MTEMDEVISLLEKYSGDDWHITKIAKFGNGLWISAIVNRFFDVLIFTDSNMSIMSIEDQLLLQIADEEEDDEDEDDYGYEYD